MSFIKKILIKYKNYKIIKKLNKTNTNIPLFSFDNTYTIIKITDVYDADTFSGIFYHNKTCYKYKFRMMGYDSPEIKPKKNIPNRDEIIKKAHLAKEFFINLVNKQNFIVNANLHKFDKYGRILVDLYLNNNSHINSLMIENNHGYPYNGGTKKDFIDDIE
jgi:endonuclease YncB( thermonuclease family)